VISAILAAVGVLATDVALGVRGLGTFVTVSVRGGVGGIGIIVVAFIVLAVAVGRITAGNRRLETCGRSWACSRKYFLLDMRFLQCVPVPSLLGPFFEDR
jgi:hypothetical protein